jgi:uncharacterized sporulation protein YeaH/YhbH (DUF444 family)
MTEVKKDLAKRFFYLLYAFLERKYGAECVEIIYIRHTDDAEEVDENTFFHDPKSGGTKVLPALELMTKLVQERYSGPEWNVYGAQASDGDAFGDDPKKSAEWLMGRLLFLVRYFAYVEVPDAPGKESLLKLAYKRIINSERFRAGTVSARNQIYQVLREFFKKEVGIS